MALADSTGAIGAVTRLLSKQLAQGRLPDGTFHHREFEVTVGRPDQAAKADGTTKLNLFLYETVFDGSLKNLALRDDQPPPLWLTLKYLLTAFDENNDSDTASAHQLLGRGLSLLQQLSYLALDDSLPVDPRDVDALAIRKALEHNPEPIKITFDEAPADLLSKIMQGTDEKYRLSVAFQVRPVMIVPDEPRTSSLLVGVDYEHEPPGVVGERGRVLDVLASLGPRPERVDPDRVEPGALFEIRGEDLQLAELECLLGPVALAVTGQQPDRIMVRAETALVGGTTEGRIAAGQAISAGEHPLVVRQRLASGRIRSGRLLGLRLLPVVAGVEIVAGNTLEITGTLLGTNDDDVIVSLYGDGGVERSFDEVTTAADQKRLAVPLAGVGVRTGEHRVIVSVNGQQARRSPRVLVP